MNIIYSYWRSNIDITSKKRQRCNKYNRQIDLKLTHTFYVFLVIIAGSG